ncbi:hypothetical protein CBW65_12165 [Tumebacillus avium]|uniref:HTH cro/C1-type domain-containing protein n=1 Tax=Tumebacillus avium TaxID=1903704 RepID=A0A1Y0IME5_9BACL|nr:helix-turn-helix transcriptional regulator [Tumebacillus avium]ARU61691.1 hypothetical protein CBW65_12165 [Tumebacillus avium]
MSFSIGQKIRDLRLKKGMSQVELAKGLCTPSMVSQIESDRARPSYKILVMIADRLDVSLEHLLKDVKLELEHTSKYKMAMGFVRAKEYQLAVPLLMELLQNPQHKIPTVDLLLELAACYLEIGEIEEAETHLREVYEWAVSRQDHHVLVTVLLQMGKASKQLKDHAIALYHTKQAWEELQKIQHIDPMLRAKVAIQLAVLNEETGKVVDAVKNYEEALSLNQGNEQERGRLFLRLAEACHGTGNFQKADEYAAKAQLLLEEHENKEHRRTWERRLILMRIDKVENAVAVQQLMEIAEQFDADHNQYQAGETYAGLARLCFEMGQVDESWLYVNQAKMRLPELDPAMGRVHCVSAELYFSKDDREQACQYLQQAMGIYKQSGKIAELEEVTLQMCHELNKSGEHVEAFKQLAEFHVFMKKSLQLRGIIL